MRLSAGKYESVTDVIPTHRFNASPEQAEQKKELMSSSATTPKTYTPLRHRINAVLHTEPFSFLFHGLFWFLVLAVLSPLIGCVMIVTTLVKCVWYYVLALPTNSFSTSTTTTDLIKEKKYMSQVPLYDKAVYVTGCDTGFGKAVAFELSSKGYFVFAGCLTEVGVQQFKDIENIRPVQVDVTKETDVNNAARIVSEWLDLDDSNDVDADVDVDSVSSHKQKQQQRPKQRFLHAVINNAGVTGAGLIDWMPTSHFYPLMEVNFMGMVRTVKSFLPILKKQSSSLPSSSSSQQQQPQKKQKYTNARIVNIVPIAGLGEYAFSPSYIASTHAAEAFSTILRNELRSSFHHIQVITVNPSLMRTTMTDGLINPTQTLLDGLSPQIQQEYGKEFFDRFMKKRTGMVGWKADAAIRKIVSSVESLKPPPQIIVGVDAQYIMLLLRMLPAAIHEFVWSTTVQNYGLPVMMKSS